MLHNEQLLKSWIDQLRKELRNAEARIGSLSYALANLSSGAVQIYEGNGDPTGVLIPDDPAKPAIYRWKDNANVVLWWDVATQTWL